MIRAEGGLPNLFFVNVSTILKHPQNIPSEYDIDMAQLSVPRINGKEVSGVAPYLILKRSYISDMKYIHMKK